MNIVVTGETNLGLANWKSFPLLEKMMRPTSASHRTERSCAFFIKPPLRFENVTCLVVAFSILLILIFRRTISLSVFLNSSVLFVFFFPCGLQFLCLLSFFSSFLPYIMSYQHTSQLYACNKKPETKKRTAINTIFKLIHNNLDDILDMEK